MVMTERYLKQMEKRLVADVEFERDITKSLLPGASMLLIGNIQVEFKDARRKLKKKVRF